METQQRIGIAKGYAYQGWGSVMKERGSEFRETAGGKEQSRSGSDAASPLPADRGNGAACVIERRAAGQDVLVVSIRGTLGAACAGDLTAAFGEGIEQRRQILLQFNELSHMDMEGASILVVNAFRAIRERIGVAACGVAAPLRDVFRLIMIDEIMSIFEDEAQALGAGSFRLRRAAADVASPAYGGALMPGWARSAGALQIGSLPAEAMNINVHGRHVTGPVKGFGRLWDKKYRLCLAGAAREPHEIVSLWKAEFPAFWPEGNRVYPSEGAPLVPGTAAVLNLALPGGLVVATGIRVIYADDTSFGFISVEGHIIAGWITFSSFREGSSTIIQVHPVFRAADPLMELGFRLGAAKQEDLFWHRTLANLAGRLDVIGKIEQRDVLADARLQWGEAGNLLLNAPLRSSLYMPVYLMKRLATS